MKLHQRIGLFIVILTISAFIFGFLYGMIGGQMTVISILVLVCIEATFSAALVAIFP
jgi:hypothetical protein